MITEVKSFSDDNWHKKCSFNVKMQYDKSTDHAHVEFCDSRMNPSESVNITYKIDLFHLSTHGKISDTSSVVVINKSDEKSIERYVWTSKHVGQSSFRTYRKKTNEIIWKKHEPEYKDTFARATEVYSLVMMRPILSKAISHMRNSSDFAGINVKPLDAVINQILSYESLASLDWD